MWRDLHEFSQELGCHLMRLIPKSPEVRGRQEVEFLSFLGCCVANTESFKVWRARESPRGPGSVLTALQGALWLLVSPPALLVRSRRRECEGAFTGPIHPEPQLLSYVL